MCLLNLRLWSKYYDIKQSQTLLSNQRLSIVNVRLVEILKVKLSETIKKHSRSPSW